jgi:Asp-tRNA(Asn)/Glu-tRNA(Gln) amidotransferase A subunit family amidase
MSDELTGLSAKKLAQLIRERKLSPVEVVEAHLGRIEHLNPKLNAIVTLAEDTFDRAREAEEAIMRGDEVGSLHGVPITIKDTIETKNLLTTAGSKLLSSHLPDEDAPSVALLKSAGAIILGKTNVPEMAIPYECDNPVFGRTNNPFDQAKTSGGSSGGEAAAIAACLSPAGLGSDLSGSIRVPAHFCGIVGLKPTTGRISSVGHLPKAEGTLSFGAVIGPMARRVEDLSLILEVLTEHKNYESAPFDLVGSRVSVYLNEEQMPVNDETERAINTVVSALSDAGFVVIEEKPPGIERAIDLWPALYSHPAAIQLREFYRGREEKGGKVVRSILDSSEGNQLPSLEAFTNALTERDGLREKLSQWMIGTPFIVAPVGATPAFEHGARRVDVRGQSISVFRAFGSSRAANVLGFPAIAVPAGRSREGLPIGVQIIGRPFEEETLLAVASILEESLGGSMPAPASKILM